MPLPLLLGVTATALLANSAYRKELIEQDRLRRKNIAPNQPIGRYPCDDIPSELEVEAEIGSIVCCGVYNGFIHTGLVLEDNLVLELHGSGLSRAVSYKRFLANRSGNTIFIASSSTGHPLKASLDEHLITSQIFAYHPYHISKFNCYSHTWFCMTGKRRPFASFEIFNQALFGYFEHSIYWDRMKP